MAEKPFLSMQQALDEKIQDVDRREHELSKTIALISERLENTTEHLDTNITNLTGLYEKLLSKFEVIMNTFSDSNKRLEKVEETLLARAESRKMLKNTIYGLITVIATVLITKWVETWSMFASKVN